MAIKKYTFFSYITLSLYIASCSPKIAPSEVYPTSSDNNQNTIQESAKEAPVNTAADNLPSTNSKQELQPATQERESGTFPLIEVAK